MHNCVLTRVLGLVIGCCWFSILAAQGVYKTNDEFLKDCFGTQVPAPKSLWLTGDRKKVAQRILDHPYRGLRARYWQKADRTAWIFEEVGKELPITIGVLVGDQRVERLEILTFRESRGWEVRHPFFTNQFKGIATDSNHELSNNIDGISGATLSVAAVKRVVRLALYLDSQTKTLLAQEQTAR